MSKTKDAFAIRDFDTRRILQRGFFRELNLSKGLTDEEILSVLAFDKCASMDEAEKKLVQLASIANKAEKFSKLIIRHLLKLQKFCSRTQQHKGFITIYLPDNAGRLSKLINAYSEIANNIDFIFCNPLNQKIIRQIRKLSR